MIPLQKVFTHPDPTNGPGVIISESQGAARNSSFWTDQRSRFTLGFESSSQRNRGSSKHLKCRELPDLSKKEYSSRFRYRTKEFRVAEARKNLDRDLLKPFSDSFWLGGFQFYFVMQYEDAMS
jgi:hypothetical protein